MATTRDAALSVVIPVYGSAEFLATTVQTLEAELQANFDKYEIILVDDASPDGSWDSIEKIVASHESVSGIQLHQNFGQHSATLCGLRAARYPYVATVDDDLQNPPDQLPILFDALTADVDLVYGYPEVEQQTGFRNLMSRALKGMLGRALSGRLHPRHSSFRLFRRSLMSAFDRLQGRDVSIDAGLSWASNQTLAVPVRFDARYEGTSAYTLRKLIRHTMNMITSYSSGPLRFVTTSGVLAGLFGFALMTFTVLQALFGSDGVQGFAFIASSVSLFAGLQLIGLGILGEYVGQIHFRTLGIQPYIVRQVLDPALPAATGETSVEESAVTEQ